MTAGTWALVAVAGATGALVRHEVTARAGHALRALHGCNIAGTLALGVLVGAAATGPAAVVLGAGGLGAFTSFSTWVVGARHGEPLRDVAAPLVLAVLAAMVGTLLGRLVGGGT